VLLFVVVIAIVVAVGGVIAIDGVDFFIVANAVAEVAFFVDA